MTTAEIYRDLLGMDEDDWVCGAPSLYIVNEEKAKVIRVSDHLPKVHNLLSNNNGVQMYFAFSSSILEKHTEQQVEDYMESIEEELAENHIYLTNVSVVVVEKPEDLLDIKSFAL